MKRIVSKCMLGIIILGALAPSFAANSESFQSCINRISKESNTAVAELKVVKCQNITSLDGLGTLKSVENLQITASALQQVPTEISTLTQLKTLVLNENAFVEIPQEVLALKQLEALYMGNNNLLTVSAQIANMRSLKVLYLNGNDLLTLPTELTRLTNLETLAIAANRMQTLPDVSKLTELKRLDVRENQLVALAALDTLSLDYLAVEGNYLTTDKIIVNGESNPIRNQAFMVPRYDNTTIRVLDTWTEQEQDFYQSVMMSNGVRPYGYERYELVDIKDDAGKPAQLTTYVSTQGEVVKSGELTAYVAALDANQVRALTSVRPIKVSLKRSPAPIPPVVPPKPPEPPVEPPVTPPIEEPQEPPLVVPDVPQTIDTPPIVNDIVVERNDSVQITGDAISPELAEANVPLVSLVAPEEESIYERMWSEFFTTFVDPVGHKWLTFENGKFVVLNMMFGIFLLFPIFSIIYIVKKTRQLEQVSTSIHTK